MTIDELRNFLKVVETGSATAAAEELYISRQGLRSAVSSLERELGAPLLKRTSKGFVLTDFGRYFAGEAAPVMGALQDLNGAYERYLVKTEKTLRISMGELTSPWTRLLQSMGEAFEAVYPQYQIEYSRRDYATSAELLNGNAEFVLMQSPKDIPGCERLSMLTTEYVVCVGRAHPLTAKASIAPAELCGERFVTKSKQTYIYRWLMSKEIPEERILFDSGNPDVKNVMLESGLVVGFSSVDYETTGVSYTEDVVQRHMDPPHLVHNFLYVKKETLQTKDAAQAFWTFAQEFLKRRASVLQGTAPIAEE